MDIHVHVAIPKTNAWAEHEAEGGSNQKQVVYYRGHEALKVLVVGTSLSLLRERVDHEHHGVQLVQRCDTHDMRDVREVLYCALELPLHACTVTENRDHVAIMIMVPWIIEVTLSGISVSALTACLLTSTCCDL